MGTLSGRQIADLVARGRLVIDPFDQSMTQGASYDLRLGFRVLASPLGEKLLGEVVDLSTGQRPKYDIQPGQIVGVLSAEKLELPLDIAGRFGIRSSFARKGINAFGGLQLDPGFRGRLAMNLLNVGPEPIPLALNEPVFSVAFQRLEEEAQPYSGQYQDQEDFPSDQYNFILAARTTSLAETPSLRKDMARLTSEEIPLLREQVTRLAAILQELEDNLGDPDEGLTANPAVVERLKRSLQRPPNQLISIEEARRRVAWA